ncbi:hypothetical protein ABZR88_15890 [Mucilaginibacter yixingensis]|nr:hypothetical protein [Mucilaginibacter yixingensis]
MVLALILSVAFFYWRSHVTLSSGITLKVTNVGPGIMDKHADLKERGSFVSGRDGNLYWKPKSLTEAMILNCIKPGYGLDMFDIVGVLITMLCVIYTFMDSRGDVVFTPKMATGFKLVIFVFVWEGMLSTVGRDILAENYLPYITNGQFRVNYDYKINSYYFMVLGLMLVLARIPKSGLDLQKEQDLTI